MYASLIPNERGRRRDSLQINIPGAVGGPVFLIKYWTPDNGHFLRNDVTTRPSTIFFLHRLRDSAAESLYIQCALECVHIRTLALYGMCVHHPAAIAQKCGSDIAIRRAVAFVCIAFHWGVLANFQNLQSRIESLGTLSHSFDSASKARVSELFMELSRANAEILLESGIKLRAMFI